MVERCRDCYGPQSVSDCRQSDCWPLVTAERVLEWSLVVAAAAVGVVMDCFVSPPSFVLVGVLFDHLNQLKSKYLKLVLKNLENFDYYI